MRILACDSGVERTGYAIFDTAKKGNRLVAYDCIFTEKNRTLAQRLHEIEIRLQGLIETYKPKTIVIEKLFFQSNQTTGIMVAQAQGVLLALAGKHNIEVVFLAPTEVKHIVTGYGKSDKIAVRKMLTLLLGIDERLKNDDVADAIACGLAYCTVNKLI